MHINYFISFLFALNILVAKAQDRKFNFGVSLFPNLSFGIISNDGSVPGNVENGFKSLEVSQICNSFGFFTGFPILVPQSG